jgi:hypothetical protein
MLDLSRPAVENWLKQNEPEKHAFVAGAEGSDESTASERDVALTALGTLLAATAISDPEKLSAYLGSDAGAKLFAEILSQLDYAQVLRLFDWVMNGGLPNADALLARLVKAGSEEFADYLKALLAETERAALATRLFSPSRLQSLQAACGAQAIRSAA